VATLESPSVSRISWIGAPWSKAWLVFAWRSQRGLTCLIRSRERQRALSAGGAGVRHGCRRGELLSLECSDLDESNSEINVSNSLE
jgi:hypothetical protein